MDDPKVGITPTSAQAASTPAPGHSSSPSFTPGPWSARDYKTASKGIWIDSFATVRGKVMGTVCEVHPLKHQEGNARLIAAAPDLYAVCETLAGWLSTGKGMDSWETKATALHMLQAALSKARGEELQ